MTDGIRYFCGSRKNKKEKTNMFRLDINLVFTICNLLFLVWLMKRFLFAPVRKVLEQRQQEIEESYKKAEETNKAADELKNKYEESLAGIAVERQQALDKVKIEASKEYDEIVNNANKKADKILADARLQAEKDAEQKQHEMQQQMAVLVAQAAYKIAASHDSSENDSKLYDTFLKEENK
jgi:F-type H+-transporting ATPase subunit b